MAPKSLRQQSRAVKDLVTWAVKNPTDVGTIVRGLLPGGSSAEAPAAELGEHELSEEVAAHDRTVSVGIVFDTDPAAVRSLIADLSLIPDWLVIHSAWRGPAPTSATLGSTFTEQVKIMGIPAEISYEVTRDEPEAVTLSGTGPMGLRLLMRLTLEPAGVSTRLWLDCGMSGDPVRGPMGGSVASNVRDALQTSLTQLRDLSDRGVRGSAETGAAPVLHHASGRKLDPHTPVIVGVGQVTQRTPEPSRDPASLAAEALRAAERDSGATGLLHRAGGVYAVAATSWSYRDAAALVAEHLGATPTETIQSARFGGDGGQALVNEAARAVAAGEHSVVLVCGAEAGASLAAAQKQGIRPTWPEQADDVAPTRVLGSQREANNDPEAAAGLGAPIYMYALIESAVRAKAGATPAQHRKTIGRLWSSLSEVAADNPHAWQPEAFTADQLTTAGPENRLVSEPYTKLLCANLTVDLASGVVVTSVAEAEAAGIPQDKWVFPHAGAAANDEWFVSERGDLAASPAINRLGRTVLDRVGRSIEEIDHVDLYSCFPAAVQIAAAELGLPVGDPKRPLSVTGGLTFAGGPGNNYGGHAIATLVQRLRDDPGSFGLTTSLGWYLTKHAIGVYSTEPPAEPFVSEAPVLDPAPTRAALTSYAGAAVIEAYTVQYARDGEPEAVILSAVTPAGDRRLVRSPDPATITAFAGKDPLGWEVELTADDTVTVTSRKRAEVPACPEPTVLVENRGPVRIITLNRPQRRNAIDLATAELLERVIDAFEADPSARVAVLTGAGGTFCAGMDLKAAAAGQFALTDKRGPLGIAALPITKPVIAAVEGHALAGGCELALVADLIVASRESEFGIPEPKRGLVAAAGGVLRLSQRLPRNVAMELALTGEPMPAARLAELGLVNRLADAGKALEVALDLADQIVVNAPISVAVSKRIVEEAPDWSRAEEFDKQSDLAGQALFSADAMEGVAAFAEHRDPVWSGR